MKLLGIDYGEKRVGVASTDESGKYALPREVLPNNEELLGKVLEFAREYEIRRIVIGESRNFAGERNSIMEKALEFKLALEREGLEVVLHPEVLSTVEARQLQGNTEMTDASAAAIILKSYIDLQNR